MENTRGHFTSRFGFLMAAAGSAIGLGNIWSFPTQAASNGGGAFVLVYLILAFLLAYPALMAELIIGRHSNANIVTALSQLGGKNRAVRRSGIFVGYYGVLIAALILSFYSIVAGWMLSRLFQPIAGLLGLESLALWFAQESIARDLLSCLIFSALTVWIVARGVSQGIEAWSTRLMPVLAALLLMLIVYVLFQPGAHTGLRHYLLPDFSRLWNPELMLSAMGQAFFSMSLGVGTMLIYGSYLGKVLAKKGPGDALPRLGATLTLLDLSFAFCAGLLIIPAMFVAQHQGIAIYGEQGELLAGPGLVFQVLPALFATMGNAGTWITLTFFALLVIASLTSSISMLECPVAVAVEKAGVERTPAALAIGSLVFIVSAVVILNFSRLFDLVVAFTTEYSQPLLGVALCLFAGWILHRNHRLQTIQQDSHQPSGLFWKIWPFYVRFICPTLIILMFIQSLRS